MITVSSGQTHVVSSGQTETGDVVLSGGILDVLSAGTLFSTNVSGIELVDGGLAADTVVNAGGFDLIFDDGITSNTIVNGGIEVVEGNATGLISGTAVSTTVNSNGDQIVFGVADFTLVNSGFEVVWSGGVSESATINNGGLDFIVGTGSNTTLNGGTEFVVSGGSASFTTVNSGGVEVVSGTSSDSGGAQVVRCTINPGGTEVVGQFGTDTGAAVKGVQLVLGLSLNAHVESGGTQVVEASGNAVATFIDGGVMEVQSGGKTGTFLPGGAFGAGPDFTSNGGILQLDFSQGYNRSSLNAAIGGFGSSAAGITEELDLRDISFGSATTETFSGGTTSGTLTVSDGTHTANLVLLGQYSTANFSLSSDGHGGTIVTDPPAVGSAAHPVLATPV